MNYWKSYKINNSIYSVDMIRIDYEIKKDELQYVYNYFNDTRRLDIVSYKPCYTSYKYKFLFCISSGTSSVSLGLCFNGNSIDDNLKGFIEFNPNKIDMNLFYKDFIFLHFHSSSFCINRFDVAIDLIGISRDSVIMLKDKRKYELIFNSDIDKTEYLGIRNNIGFVKLYNKSLEQKKKKNIDVEYDITRLEITFSDLPIDTQLKYVPDVFIFDKNKIEDFSLTQNQKVLFLSMMATNNFNYFLSMLDWKAKTKMKNCLEFCSTRFEFSAFAFLDLLTDINQFVNPF